MNSLKKFAEQNRTPPNVAELINLDLKLYCSYYIMNAFKDGEYCVHSCNTELRISDTIPIVLSEKIPKSATTYLSENPDIMENALKLFDAKDIIALAHGAAYALFKQTKARLSQEDSYDPM